MSQHLTHLKTIFVRDKLLCKRVTVDGGVLFVPLTPDSQLPSVYRAYHEYLSLAGRD